MGEDTKIIAVRRDGMVDTYAQTPTGVSNLIVNAMPWYAIIAIRCARVFVQSLLGGYTATEVVVWVGQASPDVARQAKLALLTASATVLYTCLQNAYELLTKLDQKYPELRA